MSSKTKILVLKSKEIICTLIFVILGIILIVVLFLIISGKSKKSSTTPVKSTFSAGVYQSSVVLSSNQAVIEVTVDKNQIKSIHLVNDQEAVETMYPLINSSLESVTTQIIKDNSTENVTYTQDNKYTTIVLIRAINNALKKAEGS